MTGFQRDTKDWYLGKEPLALVSNNIIKYVRARAGKKILDFGCGLGGYSARLNQLGFSCTGADFNEKYLAIAKSLGVEVYQVKGLKLDFPDNYFDTSILIEVLEHLADPLMILKEIKRVSKNNVLLTVPNCTQANRLLTSQVAFEHMLDLDHKNYFTAATLRDLLINEFSSVKVLEKEAIDQALINNLLPAPLALPLDLLFQLKLLRKNFFFRLYAEAKK